MKPDWTVWKPRLLYGAFAAAAFVLALRFTFPAEAVKERVMFEAGRRGWQVEMAALRPSGVLGLRADGLTLEDRSGLKLPVARLDAGLRVLPLLVGKARLTFDAEVLDGRVTGAADLTGAVRHVSATLSGLDATRASALKKGVNLVVGGRLGGTVDLELPASGDASKASGRIDLSMAATTLSGQLPLPGFTTGLPLPRVPLASVTLTARIDQGRATVEKLESRGGDLELATDDVVVALQQRAEHSALSGKARLRISPGFWQQPATKDLKPLADAALAQSRVADGTYEFQVGGTLGRPLLTPGRGGRGGVGGVGASPGGD
jgi:type II secretion system protein N